MVRPALPGHPPEGGHGKSPSRSPGDGVAPMNATPVESTRPASQRRGRGLGLGLDPPMGSMLLALLALALEVLPAGLFRAPRNLYTLSVQASAIAVISCGMVFVIVEAWTERL